MKYRIMLPGKFSISPTLYQASLQLQPQGYPKKYFGYLDVSKKVRYYKAILYTSVYSEMFLSVSFSLIFTAPQINFMTFHVYYK